MRSEDSVLQRLRCHPPDGQKALPTFSVVVSLVDVSCHTKVWEEKIRFINHITYNQTYSTRVSVKLSKNVPPILTVRS